MRLRETGLTWRTVGDEVIVLDLDGSVYLRLNGSGRVLWENLADAATEAQLAERLVSEFGIDRARAEADVTAFLADLRARGLVQE